MSDEAITLLRSIAERLDRIEQRTAPVLHEQTIRDESMSLRGAMQMLGYESTKRFWLTVRRLGIPYTKLNQRRYIFRREDIDAVLKQRQVGTRKVRAA